MPTVWESSARRVGRRAGGLKCSPADKCCGCCCPIAKGVQLGALTLCVLAIYSFASIFHDSGMAGGRMYLATDDREARRADSFCELSESSREDYNDCYGSDLCDCGGSPCDYEENWSKIQLPEMIGAAADGLAIPILAVGVHVATRGYQRPMRAWAAFHAGLAVVDFAKMVMILQQAGRINGMLNGASYWERWQRWAACDYEPITNATSASDDEIAEAADVEAYCDGRDCNSGWDDDIIGAPSVSVCSANSEVIGRAFTASTMLIAIAIELYFAYAIWSYWVLLREGLAAPAGPICVRQRNRPPSPTIRPAIGRPVAAPEASTTSTGSGPEVSMGEAVEGVPISNRRLGRGGTVAIATPVASSPSSAVLALPAFLSRTDRGENVRQASAATTDEESPPHRSAEEDAAL